MQKESQPTLFINKGTIQINGRGATVRMTHPGIAKEALTYRCFRNPQHTAVRFSNCRSRIFWYSPPMAY